MTVDIEKLEALAKAVSDDPSDWQPTQAAWEYHQALKDPGVVLELIAELKCPMRLARHSKRLIEELRSECEALRKDARRFDYIERDADSGMSRIYGDDWVSVIDDAISKEQSHG